MVSVRNYCVARISKIFRGFNLKKMKITIYLLVLVLLPIIKAFHDKRLITAKVSTKARREWHKIFWVYYVVIHLGFAGILFLADKNWFGGIALLFGAMTARVVLFNPLLNKLRGLDFFYLGKEGVDGLVSSRGMNKIYYLLALFIFIVSIGMMFRLGQI